MRRAVGYLALSLVLLAVAAVGGGYAYLRRSLPQVTGTLQVRGLQSPVSVYRDTWGVPHTFAHSSHDLYFAQGFVTAQDRLFQMDTLRRTAAGRLSEIFGASQVGGAGGQPHQERQAAAGQRPAPGHP